MLANVDCNLEFGSFSARAEIAGKICDGDPQQIESAKYVASWYVGFGRTGGRVAKLVYQIGLVTTICRGGARPWLFVERISTKI